MKEKVIQTIQKYAMLQPGERVVLALSGGKDSVALLYVLHALRETYRLQLKAVHVNHGIRGEQAHRDEQFVRDLCARLSVEYECFHFDVPTLAKERKISEETCGREVRYEVLERQKADKIATAHTLSDSVETMLFHLIRGCGSKGLCGIPPVRGKIIRPLIECTSEEVLAFLDACGAEYMHDSTNDDTAYSRNAVRLNVIAPMKDINPAFEEHAGQTMQILKEQSAYFEAFAQRFCAENGYNAAKIAALEPALSHEVLRYICLNECGTVPEYEHMHEIERILLSGGSVQINSGATLRVRAGNIEFPQAAESDAYSFPVSEGEYTLPIGVLKAVIFNCKQFENFKTHRFSFAVDYDKINHDLICRNKREGDRFYDAKRSLSKSMKKYLNEIGFVPEKRSAFPVFCRGEDIIGTLGSTPGGDTAVDKNTKKVLYLYLEEQ